jgi:hypothetical protein
MAVLGYQRIFNESVSQTTLTNSVELGTRRTENGNEYIYVYNNGGASITSGYGVCVSGLSGYSVTVSSVTQVNHFVGVAAYTFATATYGWVICRGWAQIVMGANNSAAVSDPIRAGTDGRFAVNSIATGYIDIPCGFSAEAIASGASGKIYFRGLWA